MNTNKLTTEQLILIVIIMMGLINGLMSCSTRQITHRPTHREIKRAMKYSTWKYIHPESEVMIPGSKSNFVFEVNNTDK
jgi:hypothetical protein